MTSEPASIMTVDGWKLVVSLDVADELVVLTSEEKPHLLDASNARRLAEDLIAAADAVDSLHEVQPS